MQNISHLSPILAVSNMEASLKFYNSLGFTTEFLWQDPPSYAVLAAGENASVHLSLLDPEDRANPPRGIIYIFVHDVDKLYQDCLDQGIKIKVEIGDRDYRMRDFEIKDPDGNLLTLGKGLD